MTPTEQERSEALEWIRAHKSVSMDQAAKASIKLTPARLRIYETIEAALAPEPTVKVIGGAVAIKYYDGSTSDHYKKDKP